MHCAIHSREMNSMWRTLSHQAQQIKDAFPPTSPTQFIWNLGRQNSRQLCWVLFLLCLVWRVPRWVNEAVGCSLKGRDLNSDGVHAFLRPIYTTFYFLAAYFACLCARDTFLGFGSYIWDSLYVTLMMLITFGIGHQPTYYACSTVKS